VPLDVARVQAICFDIDGTLRDTDDQWVARVSGLFRPLGFLLPRRDHISAARRAVMAIEDPGNLALYMADRIGLDDLIARVSRRLPPPRRIPGMQVPGMIPGVLEALTLLQARYLLAVVSARGEQTTMSFLDGNHLTPLFKAIAHGQTTRYTKPFPDPVVWVASQMGVAPSACLLVGDTTVDIRAGRAAGTQTVGVLCGFGESGELAQAGADLILPSTADLPAVLL
jgi:N-acetyl-D-muramate 6-phosphate phosphatase